MQEGPTERPTQVPATQGAAPQLGLCGATMSMVHLLSALLEAYATLYAEGMKGNSAVGEVEISRVFMWKC